MRKRTCTTTLETDLPTTILLTTILVIALLAILGGRAFGASAPTDPPPIHDLTRNAAAFSPSTGTPCAELVAEYRQAEARLARSALAVADAIDDRDTRALERACRHGEKSAAETRVVLDALTRRCPDHAGIVHTAYSGLPDDYAPVALLLSRCR